MTIPTSYSFLSKELGPILLLEALKLYGTKETAGAGNTAAILSWANEVAYMVQTPYAKWASKWYDKDSTPWCGLFMAVVACRASQGRPERFPPVQYLSALEWANFGVSVGKKQAMLGDVLVFQRSGGGHVGIYVGEDGTHFHVLGGNQRDQVNIMPIEKRRLVAVRRSVYTVQPANIRKVYLSASGAPVSTNES